MLVVLECDPLATCVVLDFKYVICHYCFIVDHEVKKRRFGRKISPIRLPPEPYARSIRTKSSLGWRNRWCEDHTACITQKSTSRWSWSRSEWYKTRFCQYCWVSKLCFDWNQVRLKACFRSSSIMHRVSPTPPPPLPSKKILHKHRPQFLLDDCNTQEKWKTNVMKNSGKLRGGGRRKARCIMGNVQMANSKSNVGVAFGANVRRNPRSYRTRLCRVTCAISVGMFPHCLWQWDITWKC